MLRTTCKLFEIALGKTVRDNVLKTITLSIGSQIIATRLLLIALAEAKMNGIIILQSFPNHSMSTVFVSEVCRTLHVNGSNVSLSSP